jgi:hypothetical protein
MGGLAGVAGQGDRSALFSWLAIVAAVLIMIATANRWAPYVLLFFGPAALKIIALLIIGDKAYYTAHSMTRLELFGFLAYLIAVVSLTSRFVGKRSAPTTIVDRFTLTFFVFSGFEQAFVAYHFPPLPLLFGVAALLIGWVFYRVTVKPVRSRNKTNASFGLNSDPSAGHGSRMVS